MDSRLDGKSTIKSHDQTGPFGPRHEPHSDPHAIAPLDTLKCLLPLLPLSPVGGPLLQPEVERWEGPRTQMLEWTDLDLDFDPHTDQESNHGEFAASQFPHLSIGIKLPHGKNRTQ